MVNIEQTRDVTKGYFVSHQERGLRMPQYDCNKWQDFATAASVEQDPQKLLQLIQQLNEALDEEENRKLVRLRMGAAVSAAQSALN